MLNISRILEDDQATTDAAEQPIVKLEMTGTGQTTAGHLDVAPGEELVGVSCVHLLVARRLLGRSSRAASVEQLYAEGNQKQHKIENVTF